MRIVFMGTPELAAHVLETLVKSNYDIVGVYTQPDRPSGRGKQVVQSPVKQEAQKYGLSIFQPDRLRDPVEIERLQKLAPDAIVVAAFGQFLPKAILEIPRFKSLNVHPSLLPKYRGPSPIAYAILNGERETGVTIMVLSPKMDAGPMLAQRRVAIDPGDMTESLSTKLANAGAELLIETLPKWFRGEITPQPQDESDVTFSRLVTKEEGFLDWNSPAEELERRIRAFQPWPGAYTKWRGRILKIIQAIPWGRGREFRPGTVLKLDPSKGGFALGIQTGEGILGLKKVQLEGRKVTSGEEFLRGQQDIVGDILPS